MRIGIITTQYAPNYGALLQAYSLQHFLQHNLPEAEVEDIDFYPEYTKRFWKILYSTPGIESKLMLLYFLSHPKWVYDRKVLLQSMKGFIKQHIKLSKTFYEPEKLALENDTYDVLICGSDQVWNVSRPEYTPVNFLSFSSEWDCVKRIAYAPSVATTIPDHMKKEIKQYLSYFDAISVREKDDVEQLESIVERKITHVCDPVFLTSRYEWEQIMPQITIKEPYIVCYFISVGDFAPLLVEKIRKLTGLKVVHVNVNVRDKFNSDYDIRTAGPLEFLSYIRNAEYVITNSFHCTAFSILFKKNLLVVLKGKANSRIESLLNRANVSNCIYKPDNLDSISISGIQTDYSNCDLNSWINDSKAFLLKNIQEGEAINEKKERQCI